MSKKTEINGRELAMVVDIQDKIYTFRGAQVMLDRDLAALYNVETRVLNQAVKRNKARFPGEFCFQLTESEASLLKSQFVMSNNGLNSEFFTPGRGGRRTRPYAFTEQGVAMLSAVLKSDAAIDVSVKLIRAFVAMRRFITSNSDIFRRVDNLELRMMETDRRMESVLNAMETGEVQPKQGIFFDGEVFDAHIFVSDLFRSADKSITIIDNYLDDSVLTHLAKRKKNVTVTLLTRNISESLAQDVMKCNEQYPPIKFREFGKAHDRFIIIDNACVYHFGASLKDLGKKWFAFSKIDIGAMEMLAKLKQSEG